jgi:hypothetical protein
MPVKMKSALERMKAQFLAHHSKNHTNHSNSESHLTSVPDTSSFDELTVHEERLWIPLFGCLFFFVALFLLVLRLGCLSKQSKRFRYISRPASAFDQIVLWLYLTSRYFTFLFIQHRHLLESILRASKHRPRYAQAHSPAQAQLPHP